MTDLTFTGWAVQDTHSPRRKVYSAVSYRNPVTGLVESFTAHGTEDQWTADQLIVRTSTPLDRTSQAAATDFSEALASRYQPTARAKDGYESILAGPCTLTLDVGASADVDPKPLLRALRLQGVMNGPSTAHDLALRALESSVQPVAGALAASAGVDLAARVIVDVPDDDRDGVPLPGGGRYLPRDLSGQPDYMVLRKMRSVLNIRLKGLPGGGKTTLPAAAFGDDMITVQGHDQLSVASLVGQFQPRLGGEFEWCWGPLARAMQSGKVFLFDEINRASPGTLNVLLSVADSRGTLIVDDRPDLPPLVAKKGFGMVVTYNEEGQGVRPLDDAVKRRFPFEVIVETDYDIAEALGVDGRLAKVGRNMATENATAIANGEYPVWRPQMADLLAAQATLDARLGDEFAAATLYSACTIPESKPKLAEKIQDVFGIANVAELTLGGAR